jgi:hypothetical protein
MKRFYFLVFFTLTINCLAQELSFENLQLKLPSTEVHQIIEDAEGFIWIATDAGVCKYDGNNLTTYTSKDGLVENVVLRMKMDSKNRIWFNTLSGFFCYYEKGRFVSIAANPDFKKMSPLITHTCSFFIGEKDTLFLSYNGPGFLKVPPKDNYRNIILQRGKFCEPPNFQVVLQNKVNPTELLSCTGSNKVEIDSTYQVFIIDTTVAISVKGLKGNIGRVDVTAKKHQDGGVYLANQNTIALVKNHKEVEHYVFPHQIFKMYIDRDGDLWVGIDRGGVYFFKNSDLSKAPIHALGSLSVSAMLLDKEGSVWIGTQEKGVFQCMNKRVYTFNEKARDFRIIDSKLHIALELQKLLIASAFDSFHVENIRIIVPESKFVAYSKVKQVEYFALGLRTFCLKNKKLGELKQRTVDIITHKHQDVTARYLINLPNDTVLAIGNTAVFTAYDAQYIKVDTTPTFSISSVSQLPDKRIIIGSRSKDGLFEYKNGKFIPFLPSINELKIRINCIVTDSSGNLWFASNEKGIFCYDTHQQLHVFDESTGLPSNKVNTIIVAPNGNIWVGTYSGLSKLIPAKEIQHTKIENYDKNHGVVDMEIDRLFYFDKGIWCGGKTTLFYFNPENMSKNRQPPVAYIKSINIKGEKYPLTDSLFLNYDQNDFHVQYELISYKKTATRSFFYKLNGYDNNWKLSTSGDIQYTNIGYGTYTLLVYAINNDGTRSNLPQMLTFIIKRPFWFTWWFITLMVIILLVLIYVSAQYWIRKIEKREHEKTLTNQKIAEFKMTALRSQMNPHFIFNAIGSIQHFILENESKQSYNYLAKFSLLIRNILNNSKNEYISLEQEVNTLQLYIELEQLRFNHPFKFILDIDEELDMETDIPTMLIQPYIENSIWHGLMPKESGGKLELILKKVGASIHVSIRDNGVGRQKKDATKKQHISKGMSLTEQRIQTLETTSNKKFVTSIIDLKDREGNPIGTEVNLIIPFCDE